MILPAYEVIIWLRSPSTQADLLDRILEKASIAPYESREWEGFHDIHWGFSNAEDAITFAERYLEFAAMGDVAKLTVLGEIIGR